ncbi:hypothetical protein Agub_g3238, partial [Astrephomene gubernaculifera]
LRCGGSCLLSLDPDQLCLRLLPPETEGDAVLASRTAPGAGTKAAPTPSATATVMAAPTGPPTITGPASCPQRSSVPSSPSLPSSPAVAGVVSSEGAALPAGPTGQHALVEGAVAAAVLQLPLGALSSPGLAFIETSCGDVLGRWVPLLVAPSEAVAAEVNTLWQTCGADRPMGQTYDRPPLEPFLCDLGRLLLLRSAGACMEEAGYTEDWEAFLAWNELRDAMSDAQEVAARLLRACEQWQLPECASLLLALQQDY